MKPSYHLDSFDQYLCLKPPLLMKLAMFYAIRHMTLIFLVYSPIMSGGDTEFMKPFLTPLYVATDLPGVLVIAAWARRHPDAKTIWRRIWRNGRVFLSIGIALNLLLLVKEVAHLPPLDVWGMHEAMTALSLFFDVLVLLYLWRSHMVPEAFAAFPEPGAKPDSGK